MRDTFFDIAKNAFSNDYGKAALKIALAIYVGPCIVVGAILFFISLFV